MDWGEKCPVDFNAGKTQLVSFDRSYNTGATDVKTVSLPYSRGRSTRILIDCMIFLSSSD